MAKLYGKNENDFAAANLMSFGKSFSRLNGQPLDKSEIWYNDFAALEAYAKTDAAYVGQIVTYINVSDDNTGTITHYTVGVNGTLNAIGNAENISNIEEILSRITKLEEDFPTNESIQTMVNGAVAAAGILKRKSFNSKEDLEIYIKNNKDIADQYIFMVTTGIQEDDDKYDEYMVIDGALEKVGSWEVKLDDYAKISDLNNYAKKTDLNNYATKEEAELNKIDSTSDDFTIDPNSRQLKLSTKFFENLNNSLNSKYSRSEGELVSTDDRAKLNALTLVNGNLQISGAITESNLSSWLTEHNYITSSQLQTTTENLANALNAQLAGLQGNIDAVSQRLTKVETALTWQRIE